MPKPVQIPSLVDAEIQINDVEALKILDMVAWNLKAAQEEINCISADNEKAAKNIERATVAQAHSIQAQALTLYLLVASKIGE